METLQDALNKILEWLAEHDRPVVALLQDGIDAQEVKAASEGLPLRLPQELVALYGWRNGTRSAEGDILDDLHFMPGYYLLSLEESLTHYRAFKDDERWKPNWFPILANGGGDFYAVGCTTGAEERAPVIGFLLDEPEQPIEYASVTSMMLTIAQCYEAGAYFLSEDGYLEVDDEAVVPIGRKFNPDVPIWFEEL